MRFSCSSVCTEIVLLGLLFAAPVIAQKPTSATAVQPPTVKFGIVTPDDFRGHPFPQDTSAEAVVLYHLGDAYVDYNGSWSVVVSEIHCRIRILKKSGTGRATVSIPVYVRASSKETEDILSLEGVTYNLVDGRIVIDKLTKAGIVTERVSDELSLRKLTLPDVREGSIIEYRYTRRTPFSIDFNPGTWSFQDNIPTLWSEYRITIANNFNYRMLLNGYSSLVINESKAVRSRITLSKAQAYHFATANVSALRKEDYITTIDDYRTKIDFELAKLDFPGWVTKSFSLEWIDFDQTLLIDQDFGKQYQSSDTLCDIANTINQAYPIADTLARLTAAQQLVSRTIKWNESNSVVSVGAKKLLEVGKGDSGDINLTLIALLREMGYEANPVVLSTRDHGRFNTDWALLKRLNYVVAHVPVGGRDLLLDATDPYLKPGMLPMRALNGMGRLVLPDKASRFIPLNPTEREVEAITAQFALRADGGISGTMTRSFGGYGSYKARKAYHTKGEADYLAGAKKHFGDWQIGKVSFAGAEDVNQAFVETYETSLADGVTTTGERLYFRPMLTEGRTTNPFREPTRQYPVDFGMLTDETYSASFTLPDGYVVDELPKPVSMGLPENGGRFAYEVTATEGKVQVVSRLSLRKPVYRPGEYQPLRELFAQVVAKHAELVVLKRVK